MKKIIFTLLLFIITSPSVFAAMPQRALFDLVRTGTPEQVQKAIKNGADINAINYSFHENLHIDSGSIDAYQSNAFIWGIINNKNPEVIRVMINNGANVNKSDTFLRTPPLIWLFIQGPKHGDLETVKLFLDKGAKINSRDFAGKTPLVAAAAFNNNIDVMQLLIDRGAKINETDSDKLTALGYAARYNNIDVVKFFLDKGADVNARNKYSSIIIGAAGFNSDPNVIKLLLDNGAYINDRDTYGDETPLMFAARMNKNPEIIRFLIAQGADINATNKKGETALMIASANNPNPAIIEALLNNNDPTKLAFLLLKNSEIQKLKSKSGSKYWITLDKYIENNGPERCTCPFASNNLDSAFGYTKNMLIERRGIPTSTYKLNDVTEILSYEGSNKHWIEGIWSGNDYGAGYHASGTEGHWEGSDYNDIYTLDKGIVTNIKRQDK